MKTGVLLVLLTTLGISLYGWFRLRAPSATTRPAPGILTPADEPAVLTTPVTPAQEEPATPDAETRRLRAEVRRLTTELAELIRRVEQLEQLRADRTPTRPVISSKVGWSAAQATGAPDTLEARDLPTAWASAAPDGGLEWLQLGFARAVTIQQVRVRETLNPGAIYRIAAVQRDGQETLLWQGTEPAASAPVEMEFNPLQPVKAAHLRVYLDTTRVAGWNEIDAVEILGTDGSRQWATTASASSSFGERRSPPASNLESTRRIGRQVPAKEEVVDLNGGAETTPGQSPLDASLESPAVEAGPLFLAEPLP